jgi:uncharacterized MAPEG superfamily protein
MTTDLWMLAYTAILCLLTPYIGIVGLCFLPGGLVWGLGNRDTAYPVPPWIERVRRAHANLVENLAPFAALVLAAHVSGKADDTTATAASVFFGARVVYTALYAGGVPYVRTLAFAVGTVAQFAILMRLFA